MIMANINDQHHDKNDHQDSGEPIPIWSRWLSPFSTFSWLLLLLALLATLLVLWWVSPIVIESSRPITLHLSFGLLICKLHVSFQSQSSQLPASQRSTVRKGHWKSKPRVFPHHPSHPCSSSHHLACRLSVRLSPSERRSRAPLSDLLLRLVAPWLPFNNCWSARAASAKCATAGRVYGVYSVWATCRLIRTPLVHVWGVYMISPFKFTLIQVWCENGLLLCIFVSSPSVSM